MTLTRRGLPGKDSFGYMTSTRRRAIGLDAIGYIFVSNQSLPNVMIVPLFAFRSRERFLSVVLEAVF